MLWFRILIEFPDAFRLNFCMRHEVMGELQFLPVNVLPPPDCRCTSVKRQWPTLLWACFSVLCSALSICVSPPVDTTVMVFITVAVVSKSDLTLSVPLHQDCFNYAGGGVSVTLQINFRISLSTPIKNLLVFWQKFHETCTSIWGSFHQVGSSNLWTQLVSPLVWAFSLSSIGILECTACRSWAQLRISSSSRWLYMALCF